MSRVAGIDLSMTSTGVAITDTDTGVTTLHTITSKPERARKRTDPPTHLHDRIRRLDSIHRRLCTEGPLATHIDLAVLEAPSYGSSNGAKHERSGLWWAVATWLYDTAGAVAEVPPSSRMKYATGSGASDKDKVLAAVVRRYPNIPVDGNDQADALILAAMGARQLGAPIDDLPATHVAAMARVDWPTANARTGALL